ncbi:hypothetical protein FHS55_001884 [Angulomicrobium tetraedrale]|uniref:Uncharacterized protein n=1 Tax=Ancylobacter tetraedralis TaxID=217068 RepID=A0A839Z9B6_9HYPH|nr:hypothetical protein [Ancylobacter tetraedralis]
MGGDVGGDVGARITACNPAMTARLDPTAARHITLPSPQQGLPPRGVPRTILSTPRYKRIH